MDDPKVQHRVDRYHRNWGIKRGGGGKCGKWGGLGKWGSEDCIIGPCMVIYMQNTTIKDNPLQQRVTENVPRKLDFKT